MEHLTQNRGNDLPRHAIFIFELATGILLSACRELLPQLIYFLLYPAVHQKRYGRSERKGMSPLAVHSHKLLSIEGEGGVLEGSFGLLFARPIALYLDVARMLDRN